MAFSTLRLSKVIPFLVNSVQAGGLMCLGDAISQKFIEKQKRFDIERNLRFGALGFFMVGPVLRTWFGILESRVLIQSSPSATALAKVALDQTFMAPIFLANFVVINSLMQGNSWEAAKGDLSKSYFDILANNYKLWPGVQLINFYMIPLNYRVLFVQCIAVLWNTYLSWKTNKETLEVA